MIRRSKLREPPGPVIRVVIADDHVTVREGLAAMIDRQPDMAIIGVADNGRDACELWQITRPDVTLLDLRMPLLDGVETLTRIRQVDPLARIIILTTFHADNDVARAMAAGARGYLLKDADREDLFLCIRAVHRGETSLAPAVIANLAASLADKRLTSRELEVLKLVAFGHGNKDVGLALDIGETTVKSHLRNVFAKLNVVSRTEAISVASKRGLVELG